MAMDVVDLRDFYRSPLGRAARAVLTRRLEALWPDAAGRGLLGFGYATPFLGPYLLACRPVALMPMAQGAVRWPRHRPNLTALADPGALPFPDRAFDRLVAVHAIEHAGDPAALLREFWRVLADDGRLVLIVPNRRGLWAHSETTPFGYGTPYSSGQAARLLRETLFTPLRSETALFMPPVPGRLFAGTGWETPGRAAFRRFGGVVLIEAVKRFYGVTPVGVRRRGPVFVVGTPAPALQPRAGSSRRAPGPRTAARDRVVRPGFPVAS